MAGAEDRATQGCDLSADSGAGIDGERANLAPAVQIKLGTKAINPGGVGAKPPAVPRFAGRSIVDHLSQCFREFLIPRNLVGSCRPSPWRAESVPTEADDLGFVGAPSLLHLLGSSGGRLWRGLEERTLLLFLLLQALLDEVAVLH